MQGFALGFLFVPLTTISLSDVPVPELADATGVFTLLRQLGGSLGIAILTTLLVHQTAIAWNVLASGVTQTHGYSTATAHADGRAAIRDDRLQLSLPLTAIVFVLSTPLVFLVRRPTRQVAPGARAAAE